MAIENLWSVECFSGEVWKRVTGDVVASRTIVCSSVQVHKMIGHRLFFFRSCAMEVEETHCFNDLAFGDTSDESGVLEGTLIDTTTAGTMHQSALFQESYTT